MTVAIENVESGEVGDLIAVHLRSLVAPLDAMWQEAIIGPSDHLLLRVGDDRAGYACVDGKRRLLAFHLRDEHVPEARRIFDTLLEEQRIRHAAVGTNDPLTLSLCLDRQQKMSLNTCLFEDHARITVEPRGFGETSFRVMTPDHAGIVERFYRDNASFIDDRGYLRTLIEKKQIFGLWRDGELLGTGERRFSTTQLPYADVGMIVAAEHRRRGLGSCILARLKETCYERDAVPICSCHHTNVGSHRAILKAGFRSRHRIVDAEF